MSSFFLGLNDEQLNVFVFLSVIVLAAAFWNAADDNAPLASLPAWLGAALVGGCLVAAYVVSSVFVVGNGKEVEVNAVEEK